MILSIEQKDVIRGIIKDLDRGEQIITFGGVAGVGKSTIIGVLLEALARKKKRFACCAYTGKATNVLHRKGIESATTIHSAIYRAEKIYDSDGNLQLIWNLCSPYECDVDGFVVDEASMVSKEIHNDLVSLGKPIIYIGDHGQLEPIGTAFNLMKDPKFKLETIHRNAGEIAHFAEHLRKGNSPTTFKGDSKVQVVKNSAIKDHHLAAADQIICAFNKSRVEYNQRVRIEKDIQYTFVAIGERIICLRNNTQLGLFNGMQGIITKVKKKDRFDFESYGNIYENIHYDIDQFGKEKNEFRFEQDENPFDYAYAITAHKAQGDQFGNIIAIEQKCDLWDHVRWCYTVASRATQSIIWVAHEQFIPKYLR